MPESYRAIDIYTFYFKVPHVFWAYNKGIVDNQQFCQNTILNHQTFKYDEWEM